MALDWEAILLPLHLFSINQFINRKKEMWLPWEVAGPTRHCLDGRADLRRLCRTSGCLVHQQLGNNRESQSVIMKGKDTVCCGLNKNGPEDSYI